MTKSILGIILVLSAVAASPAGQSQPSIQGVWRPVERVIPRSTTPGDRVDPFGHVPVGTQTDLQPGLLIFTARYYSRTTDTSVGPRPTAPYGTPGKPTVDELQVRWGPFQANAGTYELSGNTVMLRILVSKDPGGQRGDTFARLAVALDGNTLSLTPVENDAGRIVAGVTTRYSSRRVSWEVIRNARLRAPLVWRER